MCPPITDPLGVGLRTQGLSPGGGWEGEAFSEWVKKAFSVPGAGDGTDGGHACCAPAVPSLAQHGGQMFAEYTNGGETEAWSD